MECQELLVEDKLLLFVKSIEVSYGVMGCQLTTRGTPKDKEPPIVMEVERSSLDT